MTTPAVAPRVETIPADPTASSTNWEDTHARLATTDSPLTVHSTPVDDPLADAAADVKEGATWMMATAGPWVVGSVAVAQLLYLLAVGLPLAKLLLAGIFLGQAFALRFYVVNPALAAMRNRGRRFVSRQVSRGLWLVFGAWGYTMGLVPIAGLLTVALSWFGLTAAISRYLQWNLEREVAGLPVHRFERVGLSVLAVVGLVALVTLVSFAALIGWLVSWVLALIGGAA